MFLESLILTSNLPKSLKKYLRRYWRNRILELTKSYNDIDKLVYWYWRFYTGIGGIVYQYWQNCIPVLAKSYTVIDKIVYWYWEKANSFPWYTISSILVYGFTNTCMYMISPIPVYDFANTEICLDLGSRIKKMILLQKCPNHSLIQWKLNQANNKRNKIKWRYKDTHTFMRFCTFSSCTEWT